VSEEAGAVAAVAVPLDVRITLARSAIQVIADDSGCDLLHIKGAAVDRSLRAVVASGTDVDALVRPEHVARLDLALRAHGWRVYSTFLHGSPFGHAQTYWHPTWGYFDLHRFVPGVRIPAADAFAMMWAESHGLALPGATGRVPALEMQATLLVLNAARNQMRDSDPVARWVDDAGLERAGVQKCVDRLRAHVAFAAAAGELEHFRGAPDYALWKVVSQGGSRTAEWWARIRAADSLREALLIAARAPLVNAEQLEHDLGRRPTPRELVAGMIDRWKRGARELAGSRSPRSTS
jgi:hypothetical protein